MNRQDKWKDGVLVSRGIEWTLYFGKNGYTTNPVRGCKHDCKWEMPGRIVGCYAKAIKERLHGPGTFEQITWHPEVLDDIKKHKEPCGIFIDSMSDLFGQGVEKEWIDAVIATIRACPHHVFFSLTKNPSRFRDFAGDAPWPENWLCGISYPPTFMFGKRLAVEQQRAWFKTGMLWLKDSPATSRWVSIEPLSLDLSDILGFHRETIKWAVVGAGSDGSEYFQPDIATLKNTMHALRGIPVFFKGNLSKELANQVGGWREQFPTLHTEAPKTKEQEQIGLL